MKVDLKSIVEDLPIDHHVLRRIISARTSGALKVAYGWGPRKDKVAPPVSKIINISDEQLMLVRNFGKEGLNQIRALRNILNGDWIENE